MAGGDAVARITGMTGQLAPLNFGHITVIDFSYPAFVRSKVPPAGSGILICPIAVDNGVVYDASRMTEHGRALDRSRLLLSVFLYVIDLHIRNRSILRALADGIDKPLPVNSNHRTVERHGQVGCPIPNAFAGNQHLYAPHRSFVAASINGVTSEKINHVFDRNG